VTPVSSDPQATYNGTDTSWLWLGGAAGATHTVVYTVAVPQGAVEGCYPIAGRVVSQLPALSALVCGANQVCVATQQNIDYIVAHWVGQPGNGAVVSADPCAIDLTQILTGIAWWAQAAGADPDVSSLACSGDWPISLNKILSQIVEWSQIACIDSPTCGQYSRPLSRVTGPSATATRAVASTCVAAGGSTRVTVQVSAAEAITGLALDEDLPAGWTVTPVSNDGAAYKEADQQWLWLSVAAGETKTVVYDMTPPGAAAAG